MLRNGKNVVTSLVTVWRGAFLMGIEAQQAAHIPMSPKLQKRLKKHYFLYENAQFCDGWLICG